MARQVASPSPGGLSPEDVQCIVSTVQAFSEVKQLVLFGSRASGKYKAGSDVDLALKGPAVTYDIAVQIASQLNEATRMPYFFDVLDYNTLAAPELRHHIDRVGIALFDAAPGGQGH